MDFLNNRPQCVRIRDYESNMVVCRTGTPVLAQFLCTLRLKKMNSVLGCPLDPVQVVRDRRMMAKLTSLMENMPYPQYQWILTCVLSAFPMRLQNCEIKHYLFYLLYCFLIYHTHLFLTDASNYYTIHYPLLCRCKCPHCGVQLSNLILSWCIGYPFQENQL